MKVIKLELNLIELINIIIIINIFIKFFAKMIILKKFTSKLTFKFCTEAAPKQVSQALKDFRENWEV